MYTITFGGWYQRTTLHLSEIYELFKLGKSKLDLDPIKLTSLYNGLNLKSVTRELSYLEYVSAETKDGIRIKYYEDGLYVLQMQSTSTKETLEKLKRYYNDFFHPAIAYIFSLGAPTPKILADIKTSPPIVVSTEVKKINDFKLDTKEFGEVYSQIDAKNFVVYKTPEYIFIASGPGNTSLVDLIETQIFFREFKDQLETYLNIHRKIWEEISHIKERKYLKGRDIEEVRMKLDAYQKNINLIGSRINQMGTYISSRADIAKLLKIDEQLVTIFQYKFDTLMNSHSYIKEIWKMTLDYLNTAIQIVNEVRNKTADATIQSLRLITTVGVISGIIGYISKDKFPEITIIGLAYYVVLILVTWLINIAVNGFYQNRKYELKFSKFKD